MNDEFPIPLLGRKPALASRFIAAFVCLLAASVTSAVVVAAIDPESMAGGPFPLLVIACGFYMLPGWSFGYLPLFLFLDIRSRFWRWYISVPAGALIGVISFAAVSDDSFRGFTMPHLPSLLPAYYFFIPSSMAFLFGSLFNAYDRASCKARP